MRLVDFVDRLAQRTGWSRERANEAYREVMTTIRESLAGGDEVRMDGLGKLVSKLDYAKTGRPRVESENQQRVVAVSFVQFRSSMTELLALCPISEELKDVQFTTTDESAVDGGSTVIGDEPD